MMMFKRRNRLSRKVVNSKLGKTLYRLRKVTKINQIKFSHLIKLDQAAISRIESGHQALTPEQLLFLANFFGVTLDTFFTGKLNYWEVAKRFGQEPPFPTQYLENPHSKIRDILPLLHLLDQTQGEGFSSQFLEEFELDSFLFSNPDQPIGIECHLDLLRKALSKKYINSRSFNKLIMNTRIESIHGFLHPVYHTQTSSLALILAWILNSHHYENNFSYSVENETAKSLEISITPHKHMAKINYKDPILKNFLCKYKKEFLRTFPLYIKHSPFIIKEHECHFTDHAKSCIYQLKTA